MSSWVTHLWKGFKVICFLRGGLITRGTFFFCLIVNGPITAGFISGGGGLKAVVYGNLFQTFRHWGMHKEKKTRKNSAFFIALLFTI